MSEKVWNALIRLNCYLQWKKKLQERKKKKSTQAARGKSPSNITFENQTHPTEQSDQRPYHQNQNQHQYQLQNQQHQLQQQQRNRHVTTKSKPTSFWLDNNVQLIVLNGSVTDFNCLVGGAIVNATNEECLGGGGVDGAINRLGGTNMAMDRHKLPLLKDELPNGTTTAMTALRGQVGPSSMNEVRCRTGQVVITGPNTYGKLKVPFVIHSVGPNFSDARYNFQDEDRKLAEKLLQSAYKKSLECCEEHNIHQVAFSLISSGVYRGNRTLRDVLSIGVGAIQSWAEEQVDDAATSCVEKIFLFAYKRSEYEVLLDICRRTL